MVSPLKDRRAAFLLVGVVAAAIYANAIPNRFAYDDIQIIRTNTAIHSLETLPGALLEPYWPIPYGEDLGLWRPVTTALFGLQWVVGDGSPVVFHVFNVFAHAVTSLLVLALLAELLPLGAAFAGGLIFAVHPVHVEAVANIVGLSEIVSSLCIVAACLVHVRAGSRTGWPAALGIGALYMLGFGAKESAVTLPALIFLLDAARRRITFATLRQYVADRWRVYSVLLATALSLLGARYLVLGSVASAHAPMGADLLREIPRIWTLGEVWMHYVRLWVFPLDLSADYSPGVIPVSIGWHVENVLGVGLAFLVLCLSLISWRRSAMGPERDTARALAFGVVWFMITISPTSNTVVLSGILLAERTLYLPTVGLAAATGWVVLRLARERRRVAWVGLTAVVLASSVRVWTRNPTWQDNETFLTVLIRDYPQSGRSQWILGDLLLVRGQESQALLAYRAAIDLLGTHYRLVTEVARNLMSIGHPERAELLLRFAAEDIPQYPLAHTLLALVRAEYLDAEGAEARLRLSMALEAPGVTHEHLLAWALAAQGRFPEARAARDRAEEIGRGAIWQEYLYDAYIHRQEGDTAAVREALDSASVRVASEAAAAALDSVRVADFGLPSRTDPEAPTGEDRRDR